MAKINVAVEKIEELLNADTTYELPHFQRPFEWGEENAEDLLDTLFRAMGNQKRETSLGAIHLYAKGDSFFLVDGQQRHIALTILACAIRDRIGERDAGFERLISVNSENGVRYNLSLRAPSTGFFRQKIQANGAIAAFVKDAIPRDILSEENIRRVAKAIYQRLESEPTETVQRLSEYMRRQTSVVSITHPSEDDAYGTYLSLNTTGRPLTTMDKVKARLVGEMSADIADWTDKIESEVQYLPSGNPATRLPGTTEHFLSVLHMVLAPNIRFEKYSPDLYRSYSNDVLPYGDTDCREFIERKFLPYSDMYSRAISRKPVSADSAINKRFRAIMNRLDMLGGQGMTFYHSIVMEILMRHQGEDLIRQMQGFMRRVLYAFMSMSPHGGQRHRYMLGIIQQIQDSGTAESIDLSGEEAVDFINHLNVASMSPPMTTAKGMLALANDGMLGESELIEFNYPKYTLEHILPKRAVDSDWLDEFPIDVERDAYTKRLGNLALLPKGDNSRAKNKPWREKRDAFNGMELPPVSSDVYDKPRWTKTAIDDRNAHLIKYILKALGIDEQISLRDVA